MYKKIHHWHTYTLYISVYLLVYSFTMFKKILYTKASPQSHYFSMEQLHKVSLDDVTEKGFWSLSHRKVEIAVFTNAAPLVSGPLTLHCAALVLQHLPNSLLLLRASLSSPGKSAAPRLCPSSLFQRARCCEASRQTEVKWLHAADGCTVSPPGDTVYVCGIWINKWE